MTDPRLPEALKRAAELADAYDKAGTTRAWTRARQSMLGWAAAIQALANEPTRAVTIQRQEAIASFCDSMLGGDDE